MKVLLLMFLVYPNWGSPLNSSPVSEFANSNKFFLNDVFKLLDDTDENFIISPFSAETILGLTQSGAKFETADELKKALHLPKTEEEIETLYKNVLPTIKSDLISVNSANKVYVEKNLPIKEEFKKRAAEVYQAAYENLEFSQNVEASQKINSWIENETNSKIKNLLTPDDLDASTKFVLVNALYLQGNWTFPFDPVFTTISKFYENEDISFDTKMMFQESEEYNYFNDEELDAQILEISLQDEQVTVTFVLPNQKQGLSLLKENIDKVFTKPEFTREYVQVVLPKFRVETTFDFMETLSKLGVDKIFNPGKADLSGIAGEKGDLYVNLVRQKTFIDVSEIGVEAAAATAIGGNDSVPPPATKFFTADHPFIFYVSFNNIILFGGKVVSPHYG